MASRPAVSISGMRPIFAAIHAMPVHSKPSDKPPDPVRPFITISREPGIGARPLAKQLAEVLNASGTGDRPWTCWDRELVEKVAADYRLGEYEVEHLEDTRPSWVTDFLASLNPTDDPHQVDEVKIYDSVAATIRSLAQQGHVVIVGRGGVFITRRMPGGIHIRLVAPFEYRVAHMARQLNLSQEAAVTYLRQMEHNRQTFYKRYWPGESLSSESFAVTLNTATIDPSAMVETIRAIVSNEIPVAQRPRTELGDPIG